MVYKGKVTWFFEDENKELNENIFIVADDYKGAVDRILEFYGENEVLGFTVSMFSPHDIIIFKEDQEEIFNKAAAAVEENIFW